MAAASGVACGGRLEHGFGYRRSACRGRFRRRAICRADGRAGGARAAAADEIDQTQLFRLFAAAGEVAGNCPRAVFSCGFTPGRCMARGTSPLEFRRGFVEEDDPQPPESAETPNLLLPDNFDPDLRLGFRYACGGQAMLVDLCIEALIGCAGRDETGESDAFERLWGSRISTGRASSGGIV